MRSQCLVVIVILGALEMYALYMYIICTKLQLDPSSHFAVTHLQSAWQINQPTTDVTTMCITALARVSSNGEIIKERIC